MSDKSMRAACVHGPGAADDIRVESIPVPVPGPTDVLVQVHAAAVNQVDTYVRAGSYVTPMPTPFVVGRDLVGTVAAAGPGSGFGIGEPVWCNSLGHDGRQGSCAEYAVV
ncbi:MAG TPA: alcohol dehydrogenase catalytic domain-containing protein, partial [Nocardioides sp.]|nr:alcohol dehydrogenase catalytic domain-containing protein [Nocardioides sp.]